MILSKISASGLKGGPFEYDLAPATAIVGANAVGKTRILQAIRLVLGGYLPECGKTPRATWQLASGPEIMVQAEFDTGPNIMRRFWLEGDTVKVEAIVTSHATRGKGKTVSLQTFRDLPLLNNEEYFGLTDNERTEYVFERIKLPDSYTPRGIVAELQRLSFGDDHSEVIEKAKGDLIASISASFEGKITIQEALTNEIEELRVNFTYWNRRAKDTQGAVTTLAELKLRSQRVVAVADIDKELAELREKLAGEQTALGGLEAKQAEGDRNAERRAQIRLALDADRIDYALMLAKLVAEIASLTKRLTELGDVEKLKAELERKREVAREGEVTIKNLDNGIGEHEAKIAKAKARKLEVSKLNHCPWCKSSGHGWQEQVLAELDSVIEEATAAKTEGEIFLQGVQAGRKSLIGAIETLAAVVVQSKSLTLEKELKEREHERVERDSIDEYERRGRLEEELKGIPEPVYLFYSLAEVRERIKAIRTDIGSAEFRKTAETQLARELELAAKAELEHIEAEAYVKVIKALANLLKEKRTGMIEEAFTGLITIANKLTEGILREPLAFFENTIGMWIDGKFVSHKVFSGTEKALAYIAVSVALSSQAPLRLVLLDEFGRLDEHNQSEVLGRLMELLGEGVIDQFIVVGTSLPETFAFPARDVPPLVVIKPHNIHLHRS